jgi:acyl-CoA reductase-like NAD-dependent aldehyde dehydrogenase
MTAGWFGYYAGWADKIEGATIAPSPAYFTGFDYTLREPYGVVGIILTWNGPITSVGMKVAPALAAGNCVVVKTPEIAPYAVARFGELALEAGLPPGVLHILPGGPEAGDRLVRHPDVGKISFTGGMPTAQKILEAARHTLKPVVLELGGKTANLIFPDADLDAAVAESVRSCFNLSGQVCNLNTRMLVHRDVYGQAVEATRRAVAALRVGDPFERETNLGPVVNQPAYDRILGVVDQAVPTMAPGSSSAAVPLSDPPWHPTSATGTSSSRRSWPTWIRTATWPSVKSSARCFRSFPSRASRRPLAWPTRRRTGCTAVQTRDVSRVLRIAPLLQSGNVHFNGSSGQSPGTPFGGYKQSGLGREGGKEGLDEYLQTKNVYIRVPSE